ncbi:MAG TPA: PepSY domain-containing protein [Candidatus Desulfobacillus sp.]|nr:PepSY domain-containing protein [Candidatus Desulfobacillus sp.]
MNKKARRILIAVPALSAIVLGSTQLQAAPAQAFTLATLTAEANPVPQFYERLEVALNREMGRDSASAGTPLLLAQAQTTAPARPASRSGAAPQLSIRDIYDRMEAAGYRDLREIDYSHGRYEVKASDAQGGRVKLDVNADTGAVERVRKSK